MRDYEHYTGKLKKISFTGTVDDFFKQKCKEELPNVDQLPQYYNTWQDYYLAESINYEKYIVIKDIIYEVIELNKDEVIDTFIKIKEFPDNTIEFECQYYNNDTDWQELLKESV